MTLGTLAIEVLAQEPTGPEFGKASPVGLALVLVLLVAIALLIWNMNKRLSNLPESFDTDSPEADQAADEGTDRGAAAVNITKTDEASAETDKANKTGHSTPETS
ncbi:MULTISPECIES: hypothetical protein [unclassified Rhodococcus (in: high G+C Gram-positive bacteria)]|uniref:hypothetical protein n=1 Tax=Rhodococcus sp. SJ-3 TaxID=3454628 RepID=UPI002D9200C1|nr:hypothetical protein [Rhodococcus sp. (in: high G+C Gram-positive bacteria)]